MEIQERMEREINLVELFWNILLGWRQIICVGVLFAVLLGGIKYLKDSKVYRAAQKMNEEEIVLTLEEEQQVEEARVLVERIEKYKGYLEKSVLMQINPYEKPIVELQYYVESDYTYNYTKDNESDYTNDLMSLYYNYVKSGEMSDKLIDIANLKISQADFSELCAVTQNGKTMLIAITWAEEAKLKEISECMKTLLSKKELNFQEVGSHKLKLLRESQNVIVDTELAEKRNTYSNNIAYINTQLTNLKTSMSEPQLKQLNQLVSENESGNDEINADIAKPDLSLKYIVLGAGAGMFLMCFWIFCKMFFTVRLQNSEEMRTLYNIRLLGEITVQSQKKLFLSVIDDKLLKIKNRRKKKLTVQEQIKVLSANIALTCKKQGIDKIYMTGSEYESVDTVVLDMLKKEMLLQHIQIKEGGNIFYNAESLREGTEIGNILFVEQIDHSIYDEISNELNLAKEQKNNIIGAVILT